MALGISRVFKSTDASAPQFAVSAGQFKDVLKAVLVNGYGSTPSLGWTLEYEVGNVAVFRMKAGTRYYIRVDDSVAGEYAYITGFKTMDSVHTGTERVPSLGLTSPFFRKRLGGTTNVPWMIIGDDAGFIILTKARYAGSTTDPGQNMQQICYIGDYVPFDIKNKWNFCILTSYTPTSATCGLFKHAPSNTMYHVAQRDHSYKKGSIYCGVSSFGGGSYFGQGWGVTMTGGVYPAGCIINGSMYSSPVFVYATALDTNLVSSTCALGIIPGVTDPIMTDGESGSASIPITSMNYTFTGPDYTQMLLYLENQSGYGYNTINQSSSKLLVKIGKGFRNV
jgi:hypothetical protein